MQNKDELVGNPDHDNSTYVSPSSGDVYLVYLPDGGTSSLDLTDAEGQFHVAWFNPRAGGDLQKGSTAAVSAGSVVKLGQAPTDQDEDWLVVVRKAK